MTTETITATIASPITARLCEERDRAEARFDAAVKTAQTKTNARDLMTATLTVAAAESEYGTIARAVQAARWADASTDPDINAASVVKQEALASLIESVDDRWSGRGNEIIREAFAAKQVAVGRIVNLIDSMEQS